MPKLPPPKLIFLAFDGQVTLTFRQVVDSSGSVVQENHYYPYGALMGESTDILAANGAGSSDTNPYKFGGKELLAAQNANLGVYPARVLDFSSNTWAQSDPCCEITKEYAPYVICAANPIRFIDPNGEAWKPVFDEENNEFKEFEWIDSKVSYDANGDLLPGLYEQAIFFSDEGTFDASNDYNIGSSIATVYKSDGSTECFKACTHPSNPNAYTTVPAGMYEAKCGMHKNQYSALRMADVGCKDFGYNTIKLTKDSPLNPRNLEYSTGINIHRAGNDNKTGMTTSKMPISKGCILIDINAWSAFMKNFDNSEHRNNIVGIIIQRR